MQAGLLARQILLAMAGVGASSACQSSQPAPVRLPDPPRDRGIDAGAATTKSDLGPFADRFPGANAEAQRACIAKPTILAARGASGSSMVACPSQRELVRLGLGPHDDPHEMAGCSTLGDGPAEWKGECCYLFTGCTHTGRPFLVNGAPREALPGQRTGWTGFGTRARRRARRANLDTGERAALAKDWAADAVAEHASVASFSRFALDLLGLAAPSDLLAASHRAALDEIDHARLCFTIASHYAGEPIGPGPLDVRCAVGHRDLRDAAVLAFQEGCIGETEAALIAAAQLEGAKVPLVRRALTRIAGDEANHATLAWRFVAWAIAEGGESVRDSVAAAFQRSSTVVPEPTSPDRPDSWRAHGRLGPSEIASARLRARRDIIAPCAHALLSR